MKVTWEPKDIRCGRKYSKEDISEVWTIGFLSFEDGPARYVSISGDDGMVTKPQSKEDMAESLTNGDYLPLELKA